MDGPHKEQKGLTFGSSFMWITFQTLYPVRSVVKDLSLFQEIKTIYIFQCILLISLDFHPLCVFLFEVPSPY